MRERKEKMFIQMKNICYYNVYIHKLYVDRAPLTARSSSLRCVSAAEHQICRHCKIIISKLGMPKCVRKL